MLGHPLIEGETFTALSQDDVLMKWTPGTDGEIVTLAHPLAGTPEPQLTPVAAFGGYPLARCSAGFFLADDQVNPFISVFSALTNLVWHRDILNRLGVPAVQQDLVFANAGGANALNAIVALDSSTGATKWKYAPNGLGEEPSPNDRSPNYSTVNHC